MAEPVRIAVGEAGRKVESGEALLVCAYPDEEVYRSMRLGGSISFDEFEARLPSLPKDQEIIFYCA